MLLLLLACLVAPSSDDTGQGPDPSTDGGSVGDGGGGDGGGDVPTSTLCPDSGPWAISWSSTYGLQEHVWTIDATCEGGVASALWVDLGDARGPRELVLEGGDRWIHSRAEVVDEEEYDWQTTYTPTVDLTLSAPDAVEGSLVQEFACTGGDCSGWDDLYRGDQGRAVVEGAVWGAPAGG